LQRAHDLEMKRLVRAMKPSVEGNQLRTLYGLPIVGRPPAEPATNLGVPTKKVATGGESMPHKLNVPEVGSKKIQTLDATTDTTTTTAVDATPDTKSITTPPQKTDKKKKKYGPWYPYGAKAEAKPLGRWDRMWLAYIGANKGKVSMPEKRPVDSLFSQSKDWGPPVKDPPVVWRAHALPSFPEVLYEITGKEPIGTPSPKEVETVPVDTSRSKTWTPRTEESSTTFQMDGLPRPLPPPPRSSSATKASPSSNPSADKAERRRRRPPAHSLLPIQRQRAPPSRLRRDKARLERWIASVTGIPENGVLPKPVPPRWRLTMVLPSSWDLVSRVTRGGATCQDAYDATVRTRHYVKRSGIKRWDPEAHLQTLAPWELRKRILRIRAGMPQFSPAASEEEEGGQNEVDDGEEDDEEGGDGQGLLKRFDYLERRRAVAGEKRWDESGRAQTQAREPKPTLPHQRWVGEYGPKADWGM
jgi:hypothetical protein